MNLLLRTHRRLLIPAALAAIVAAAVSLGSLARPDRASATSAGSAKPTIVLVHGAFADASGFAAVAGRLQADGYTVIAPANPLRGLASDSAYVASVLKTIKGPVVLVGHSYGGAVITAAGSEATNVKALVYLNAFALDKGESAGAISQKFTNDLLATALVPRAFTNPDGSAGTDLYIDTSKFRAAFAADVPKAQAAFMAAAQRPVTQAAFGEPLAVEPAWKTIPSWYLVGSKDKAIDPAAERFMAKRAGAHTTEIDSSHVSYISHPAAVTKLILQAAASVK
jgi:pimeloyl-ACP methyl ester carboxylesterase